MVRIFLALAAMSPMMTQKTSAISAHCTMMRSSGALWQAVLIMRRFLLGHRTFSPVKKTGGAMDRGETLTGPCDLGKEQEQ
jgi:hypothetical protein